MKAGALKAFFPKANVPSSARPHLRMALSYPFSRGAGILVCLFLFGADSGMVATAQDTTATGPIPTNSSNYQKAPVSAILDLYEQLSGKHLIRDVNLDGMQPVSINATGLSKPEMLKLIEEALLLNGVAMVPVDDQNLKVVMIQNKNPRSEGPKIYANAADLPTTDEVVSYYMPLNYLNPQEAVGIFTGVAPMHQYGAYTPALTAQAVILTENVSVIRQLIALKELIDEPPARVSSEWIQLNRADSDKVADILNKMLGLGPTGAPAAGGGPGGIVEVPSTLGLNAPLSNEKNLISGPAQIISDPRSNRILVITRPVNMPFLEQMVAQLDEPDIFLVPQRRALNYVLAANILPALEAALAQGKDEEDQLKKDETAAQSKTSGQTQGGGGGAAGNTGGSSGGSGSSQSAITPQLSAPAENDVPTVVTIGNTRLMADNRSNSIIVFGSPDVVARVFNMIDQLDTRPLQVYLATVIGQLQVKQGQEFGIDILQKFQHVGQGGFASSNINTASGTGGGLSGTTTGTSGTTTASGLLEPTGLISSTGFPLLSGLSIYGAIGNTLNAYVRALETTDRFKIISRPSVYTTNNKLAVIASGSQVPVPSSTTTAPVEGTTAGLGTTSSIAYENVLLQLDIIPLINANHDVTLQIRQTNNSLGNNVDISGNEVPTINTQEINTEVTVPNKSTVVIGGLIDDNTSRDTSGVPILSDIPILKYLFSDTTKSKERDELIIMIQPSVVETDADQIAVNQEEKQRTILGRESPEAGSGESLPQPSFGPTATIRPTAYSSKNLASPQTTSGSAPASLTPAPEVGNEQIPVVSPPAPSTTAP